MNIDVFAPVLPVLAISSSAASVSATLGAGIAASQVSIVRIYNQGPNTAFVRWGVGAQTAILTDLPLPSGDIETFDKGIADTFASICSAGSSAIVFFAVGRGA